MNDLSAQAVSGGLEASASQGAGVLALHPAFDVVTQTWFLTKPVRCESTSLRGLLEDLRLAGHDVQLEGYYPNGYTYDWGVTVNDQRDLADKRAMELARDARRHEPKAKRPPRFHERIPGMSTGRRTKYDREAILNMWFANIPTDEIERATGAPKSTICNVLQAARYQEDSRAVHRIRVRNPRKLAA